jgi:hypothetical protein
MVLRPRVWMRNGAPPSCVDADCEQTFHPLMLVNWEKIIVFLYGSLRKNA